MIDPSRYHPPACQIGDVLDDLLRGPCRVAEFTEHGWPVGARATNRGAESAMVYLAEEEHRQLKILAAQSDTSISGLVRRALYAAGIVTTYSNEQ